MPDYATAEDSTLLNEFRHWRSEAAFTELVRRHLPLVFHVALRRLGSAALAEEATQQAFTRLAAKAAAVARHPERLKAWLHRTAYFEASTLARKELRLSRLPLKPDSSTTATDHPEIYDRLHEALSLLPELDRELVLRHCCGGENYRRMAAAVGKSEAACQKRVERALTRLGRGLGGAKTAASMVAVFSAAQMKSQAMPAAQRMAAAVLKHHPASANAISALSGMKLAACAALALVGGAAGWQQEELTPAPPAVVRAVAARSSAAELRMISKANTPALAPRPVSIVRSLDDILETIQAGRFGPLVEFLPKATVTDLQAIIAEDDFYSFGEQDGIEHFGTARNMALLRWAEIDPEGAFRFGINRDLEQGGFRLGDSTAVLAKWLQADTKAAAKAFENLPGRRRVELMRELVDLNRDAAAALAAALPRLAWVVTEQLTEPWNTMKTPADAEWRLAKLLSKYPRSEPENDARHQIYAAFKIFAAQDHAETVARAETLPWPAFRAEILSMLYENNLPKSTTLPLGELRTHALFQEAEKLTSRDPEAAILKLRNAVPGSERDAIYQAVSRNLAGSDPWRLLDIIASLSGYLDVGDGGFGRALEFAGRDDPQRALAALARLASNGEARGGAKNILAGWVQKDPVAAIRWAGKAGIRIDESDGLTNAAGGPAPLLILLKDENEEVRLMARSALVPDVEEGLKNGTAADLLAQMPQPEADKILSRLAEIASMDGKHDEALRIAAVASSAAREKEILPWIAFVSLRDENEESARWLSSLSLADQRAVVAGVEKLAGKWNTDAVQIRQRLRKVIP